MLSPGDRFEGYVIDETVGRGGSAIVYRAHDVAAPERQVALKIARGEAVEQQRLRREFDYARRFSHPHIVEVFDSGSGWLAMTLAGGGSVKNLATLPNRMVALSQIADALDHIHSLGVVHCDVKPANILVTQNFYETGALLVDFGNARSIGETSPSRATRVTASLPYAPPELLTGRAVSAATDSYALACTIVEMVTGRTPFTANTQAALTDAQLHSAPPRPSRHIDWLPTAFDSMLAKAMAKNPDDRYQSCTELTALITRVVRD
ncbi:serine/threonine-protein kinase [Mycobacterium sp. 236(2023)]|uniref:serine/threonine-protein kinase n=1 Tax=Mycobacterium sp. 236(2023) TaxID=3038163 RepID=UPI002415762E|nr:serine/threonine-protein kinase [Mycobacterium sp. 236(2023)]MDG4665896.1 serine/threonine-protein kinase [Mycobacterium sp. 236(2023)]